MIWVFNFKFSISLQNPYPLSTKKVITHLGFLDLQDVNLHIPVVTMVALLTRLIHDVKPGVSPLRQVTRLPERLISKSWQKDHVSQGIFVVVSFFQESYNTPPGIPPFANYERNPGL